MDFELTPSAVAVENSAERAISPEGASFQVSARPIVPHGPAAAEDSAPQLPRSYGTETLSLLARDPHSIFAFWDIDWNAAFADLPSKERKVHLRLLGADGEERRVVEVQPMAGNCYITVADADATYSGQIGYYDPAKTWRSLAASELVITPSDAFSTEADIDFATVPFHLSFQRMVDLLQETQRENTALTAMLADLRARVAAGDNGGTVTAGQKELVRAVADVAQNSAAASLETPADPRLQQRLERIVTFGSSSPSGGFGGSSRSV